MAMSTRRVVERIDENVAVTVRTFIADYLHVDARRVSNDAHFGRDLGANWLDRLELLIALEDRFGVEIDDDAMDHIEAVADLVHVLEAQPLH
jgi:acyl carrier protein